MTIESLLSPVLGNIGRPFEADDCPETINGWDSIKQLEIIVAIEDGCHVELTTAEILRLKSIGAIVDILHKRGVEISL